MLYYTYLNPKYACLFFNTSNYAIALRSNYEDSKSNSLKTSKGYPDKIATINTRKTIRYSKSTESE